MKCPKFVHCEKIKMLLDKDLLDFQLAELIRNLCATCSEPNISLFGPDMDAFSSWINKDGTPWETPEK